MLGKNKSDHKAKKPIFFGFSTYLKGYRLWYFEFKKVTYSRDVIFDKPSLLKNQQKILHGGSSYRSALQQVDFEIPNLKE